MFGHIHIWHFGERDWEGDVIVTLPPSQMSLFFPPLLHITVYFPFHFILTLPPFFHPTSPVPSIPRASSSQTRQTGFFGTPRAHKHTLLDANVRSDTALHFNRGSVTQFLRTEKEKTENDKQTEKKEKEKGGR